MSTIVKEIESALIEALEATKCFVEDESYQHRKHAGYQPGKYHIAITIHSSLFEHKSLLDRHRMIHQVLEPWMEQLHAIKIKEAS